MSRLADNSLALARDIRKAIAARDDALRPATEAYDSAVSSDDRLQAGADLMFEAVKAQTAYDLNLAQAARRYGTREEGEVGA